MIYHAIIEKNYIQEENSTKKNKINYNEIPYISTYYFNPKPSVTEDCIIDFYVTDYSQKEYLENEQLKLDVQYTIDDEMIGIITVKAGDNKVNLGKLSEGEHFFSLQAIDKETGLRSAKLYNEVLVIDPESYDIKDSEIYYVKDEDLKKYGIDNNNSDNEQDMINTREGLNNLFITLKDQGYRKCVLPKGYYRVKCTSRTECINIPTNFTVDMNKSTFKLNTVCENNIGISLVRMDNTFDSHLINGILEGDRFERKDLGLEYGYNGEPINTLYIAGGKYSSIEDLTIKSTTGHTIGTEGETIAGAGNLTSFIEGIVINGVLKEDEKWCTSELKDISSLLNDGYIMTGTYLGYRGVKGESLTIYYNFYDENKEFIETVVGYQYRKCRIPNNSKYVTVSFYGEVNKDSNISLFYRELGTNWSYKNINFIDTRTTAIATSTCDDLLIENCSFTRCGNSITPAAVDFEDGWQECQDVYFRNCDLIENGAGNTIIDNTGFNHVYENNNDFSYLIRYSVVGLTVRNSNSIPMLRWARGYETGSAYSRVYNNIIDTLISISDDNDEGIISTIIKDSTIRGSMETSIKTLAFENCDVEKLAGKRAKFINCDIDVAPYLGEDYIFENCNFYNKTNINETMRFSFNAYNAYREFTNCKFKSPVNLDKHNEFNSGIFNNCVFEKNVTISPNYKNNLKDIQFNNCIFKSDLNINICDENCFIEFNNCQFKGEKTFKRYGEKNSIFNNNVNSNEEDINLKLLENILLRGKYKVNIDISNDKGRTSASINEWYDKVKSLLYNIEN